MYTASKEARNAATSQGVHEQPEPSGAAAKGISIRYRRGVHSQRGRGCDPVAPPDGLGALSGRRSGSVRRIHVQRRRPAGPGAGALMARYMLDTDTCSYIMKRSSEAVIARLRAVPITDVCISVITKSELLYGVEVSPRRTQDASALQAFLPHVAVLEFRDDAADHYAQIRADLKKRGQMIGANDLF